MIERQDGTPEVWWLANDGLRLGIVPELGGRLLSLSGKDGRELLWRNDDLLTDDLRFRDGHLHRPVSGGLGDWVNYGGDKTWPAPQGWAGADQWAGPPDPVLDSGAYTVTTEERADAAVVTLTSGDEPRTGLRLGRRSNCGAARAPTGSRCPRETPPTETCAGHCGTSPS